MDIGKGTSVRRDRPKRFHATLRKDEAGSRCFLFGKNKSKDIVERLLG